MKLNPSIKNMSNEYIFFTDQTALTFRICLVGCHMTWNRCSQHVISFFKFYVAVARCWSKWPKLVVITWINKHWCVRQKTCMWCDISKVILFWSEVKWSELRSSSWGKKYHVHQVDLILRLIECNVTILFGVYLVLWLF